MNKIEFIPFSKEAEELTECPQPSSSSIPEWYKKSFKFKTSNRPSFDDQDNPEFTIKSCIPVFDSINAGYIQKTWSDIFVEVGKNNEILFRWSSGPQPIFLRPDYSKQMMPTPDGYNSTMLTWSRPWGIKTPNNYSVILMHPSYRDLPFICFPGIIDSDFYHNSGTKSVPFYIKDGFSGLIPKGTPMYQIIPIKREKWKSEKRNYGYKNLINDSENILKSRFYDRYKKSFWQKKAYG